MGRIGLSNECQTLELIISNLETGKDTCEIGDTRYSLKDAIDYLRDYLQELRDLDSEIVRIGNTPEMLEAVYRKYTELWLFQLSFYVSSLPLVIGGLQNYANQKE